MIIHLKQAVPDFAAILGEKMVVVMNQPSSSPCSTFSVNDCSSVMQAICQVIHGRLYSQQIHAVLDIEFVNASDCGAQVGHAWLVSVTNE